MSLWKIFLAGSACLLLLNGCHAVSGKPPLGGGEKPTVGTSFVMDTVLEYKLFGKNSPQAADNIVLALQELERQVSVFLPDSQISQLNRNAGIKPVELTTDVYELLRRTVEFSEESGGTFDLTIAPLTRLWDVTAEHPRIPAQAELDAGLSLVNYRDVLPDPQGSTAMLARQGQMVDLGGVAKGYACDLTRRVALENGIEHGYLSIGGNLMVIGGNPDSGEDFKFGVRDPRGGANDFLAVVTLPDSTMATSGDYERYFEKDGVRYHHILDPATGMPAQSDLWSVSVVTPDGAYADLMSTWLFLKGREFVLAHLDSFDCGLIIIDNQRRVYVSKSLEGQVTPSDPTGSYRFEATP